MHFTRLLSITYTGNGSADTVSLLHLMLTDARQNDVLTLTLTLSQPTVITQDDCPIGIEIAFVLRGCSIQTDLCMSLTYFTHNPDQINF